MYVETPEFFKVYIPDLSSQRLRIPPAFIKHFKGTIPEKAILKDLSGKLWHVELKEDEKNVFIHNGWEDFLNDNSVKHGDFLVFTYSQNCTFEVKLFGKDGCMKENAIAIVDIDTHVKKENDPEVEKTDHKHNFPRACKRKLSEISPNRIENLVGSPNVKKSKAEKTAAKNVEKHKAVETENFVLPKNPHFITSIYKSHQYCVHVPVSKLKENKITLKPSVKLRDQNGKLWPVKVTFRDDGRIGFTSGWSNFWEHSKLAAQDKCLFEFILGRGRVCKEVKVQVLHAKSKKNSRSRTKRRRS